MADYNAPLQDMNLALSLAGIDRVTQLPGYEEATPDLVSAVLEEAARLGSQELAPLNEVADRVGCKLENGVVHTYPGLKEFYSQFVEGGWNAIPFDPDFGGQGLPWLISAAVQEIWQSSNPAFAIGTVVSQGAVDLLSEHGSDEQKALYLPKMISGEWTGTMNLTEPQAGSDLAQVRTKAVPVGDGTYKISGQKIFITFGDHDLNENIIHLVLARLPDAPAGVKGISLFLVPKFLLNADGTPGARNDVVCASLEHKMGIHGSPTAVMAFGDDQGAIGWLIGEENRGLNYMFTMMNNARLHVGLQGYAIAERAYQHARAFAKERVQSRPVVGDAKGPATIIHHPDVRRMLLTMKALTEGARLLTLSTIGAMDLSIKSPDADVAKAAAERVALLTPIVKLWGSEVGCKVADLGIQVFGGVGFVEETGAAQFFRDARIAPIYEGTNGIQAADLVGRKVQRDQGAELAKLIAEIRASLPDLDPACAGPLETAIKALETASAYLLTAEAGDAYAAATPFAHMFSLTMSGWLLARAAKLAESQNQPADFVSAKAQTARFFSRHLLPAVTAHLASVEAGSAEMMGLSEDQF